jgi:hypothetical protein
MSYARLAIRRTSNTRNQDPRGLANPGTTLDQEEAHRFIHHDPFQEKVWELDGLESRPTEVWRLLVSRMYRKGLVGFNRRSADGKTQLRR